ncbi:MAG TPA: helix-turn-helix transcriptional regulator [Polyangiaceae bacterium]
MDTSNKEQRVTTPGQVADILRQRRRSRGLSQTDVAFKLGLSQARVSAIESKPASLTLERLIALASVLDLEVVLRDRSTKRSTAGW